MVPAPTTAALNTNMLGISSADSGFRRRAALRSSASYGPLAGCWYGGWTAHGGICQSAPPRRQHSSTGDTHAPEEHPPQAKAPRARRRDRRHRSARTAVRGRGGLAAGGGHGLRGERAGDISRPARRDQPGGPEHQLLLPVRAHPLLWRADTRRQRREHQQHRPRQRAGQRPLVPRGLPLQADRGQLDRCKHRRGPVVHDARDPAVAVDRGDAEPGAVRILRERLRDAGGDRRRRPGSRASGQRVPLHSRIRGRRQPAADELRQGPSRSRCSVSPRSPSTAC